MLPDGYTDALTRERPDHEAGFDEALGDVERLGSGREPDEVPLRFGDRPAGVAEPGDERVAALRDDPDPVEEFRLRVEAREGRRLGVGRDRQGDRGAAGGIEDARVPDRIADAEARE